MFEIVVAHGIKYAATASVGYLDDFINKVQKAKECDGPSYIHVYSPCPTGWGHGSEISVDLGKEVVDTGLWYLAEFEDGEYRLNKNPNSFKPVKNHLMRQARFKHISDEEISIIESQRDKKWEKILRDWNN